MFWLKTPRFVTSRESLNVLLKISTQMRLNNSQTMVSRLVAVSVYATNIPSVSCHENPLIYMM